MKFKNLIMFMSCFLIFTSSVECGSIKLGNSGYKFSFKSKKIVPNHQAYKGKATSARGKKNCAKLKSICNDLRFTQSCEYIEWQHTTLFGKKPKKVECACKGVKLLPY